MVPTSSNTGLLVLAGVLAVLGGRGAGAAEDQALPLVGLTPVPRYKTQPFPGYLYYPFT